MVLSTLIVNADDFGMSSIVNRAILTSMEEGLVTSTSMMANMPGFDHAVGLARVHAKLAGRIGVHLNLTQGRPLSKAILDCPQFCDASGEFVYQRTPLFFLSKRVREAVYLEFKAQVERLRDAGIEPIHIDSHHHIHNEWALAPLACRLANEYGIRRIRLARNIGVQPNKLKRLYKTVLNRWRLGGFRNTEFFGDIEDMLHFSGEHAAAGKLIEIMVHPLFDGEGELVDMDMCPLQARLEPILGGPINLYPKLSY